jgi:hypothetical protein
VLVKNAKAAPQIMEAFAPCEGIGHLGSSLEFTFTAEHIDVERLSYLKTSDNCLEKTKFAEAQIVFALRQADTGITVAEVCCKMGISSLVADACGHWCAWG